MSNSQLIEVKIGASVKELVSESPVKFDQDCLPQASFCFYEIDKSFGDKDLPSVIVNDTFRANQVVNVTISANQVLGDAIENLKLIVKTIPSNSRHEEYRTFIYGLIAGIKSAGWAHYYYPPVPRISGVQYHKITSSNKVFGKSMLHHIWLDPDYEMSMDQWLKTGSFYTWNFYKDGNYLTLDAWRRDFETAPNERGTYLVSLAFRSESSYWRSEFKTDEDKNRWKELLPDLLTRYGQERESLERLARQAGVEINTSYQDPPIMALKSD